MFSIPANIPWKWIGIGLAALAVVATVFFSIKGYGNARYDTGVAEERAIWEKIVADQKLTIEKLQRAADASLEAQKAKDAAKIEASRKEVEDALAEIPDQQTSDRQRTRACLELMRAGQAPASCQSDASP